MKKIFLVLAFLTVAVGAFFLGRGSAPEKIEVLTYEGTSFYAKIESVQGSVLLVEGLPINDINMRGKFTVTVDESTQLLWHGTQISLSDLHEGATVCITYTGLIQELYPANIVQPALQIVLLDDSL